MRYKRLKKRRNKLFVTRYQLKHDLKIFLYKFSKYLILAGIIFLLILILCNFRLIKSVFSNRGFTEPKSVELEELRRDYIEDDYGSTSEDELVKLIIPNEENTLTNPIINYKETKKENKNDYEEIELINTTNVEYQSKDYYEIENHFDGNVTIDNLSQLKDLNYLKNNFYIVDAATDITADMFNVEKFLDTDLKLKDNKGPKVLIFTTHSQEVYKGSKDQSEGVVGLSYELQRVLKEKYGIESIVDDGVYDVVDGVSSILGAYQRMTPNIEKILEENPSIEVCIDIHRDGVPENVHLVTNIEGRPTAQFMFVNGLSKVWSDNGTLKDAPGLPNKNLSDNLAFSFNLKLAANELYPNLTRKIYLHAYRYSLFMKPKSILVEIGAQTNTYEEARNAIEPLANVLASTLK